MFFDRRCNFCCCAPCCCRREEVCMEPTVHKCIEREFCHEVPHICPIHTHTINKHVYRHTYTPQYTVSEEDVIINEECGSCCNFV